MSLNLGTEIAAMQQTLKNLREVKLIKKAKGRDGKLVREMLSLMELQLNMLSKGSEKVKVAIEARDMTIHHLGEQLMDLRSRDDKPVFMDAPTLKKDPGLYRPDMYISDEKRQNLENDMYMQMARLSLGMGGAKTLGIDEKDFEEKVKEVAENLKNQAEEECVVRQESLSFDGIDGDESFSYESPLSTPSASVTDIDFIPRAPMLPETPLRRHRAPSLPDVLRHSFSPKNAPSPRSRRATFSL